MAVWLLPVVLLAGPTEVPAPPDTPAPILWRLPAGRGGELERALTRALGTARRGEARHLIALERVEAFLGSSASRSGAEGAWVSQHLGCLDDSGRCADPTLAGLGLLGFSALIDATARPLGEGRFAVRLVRAAAGSGRPPDELEAEGATMDEAVEKALAILRGSGSLEVDAPPGTRLSIEGVPFGAGPGRFELQPGLHVVRAELHGHRPQEQPVELRAGTLSRIAFVLQPLRGLVELAYTPSSAVVYLDGVELATAPGRYPVAVGRHTVRVQAPGYEPEEQEVLVAHQATSSLEIALRDRQVPLLERFAQPHPDVVAHPWYVRADLRFVRISDGATEAAVGRGAGRLEVDDVEDSTGLLGVSAAAGWRGRYLTVEALGLGLAAGGDRGPAVFTDATGASRQGTVDEAWRWDLRVAWLGARYPAWRLEPYLQGGLGYVSEAYRVRPQDSLGRAQDARDLDHARFTFGFELGLRYQLTPDWFGALSGAFDLWPGEPGSAALVFGVGYALDRPEGL